MKYQTIIFVWSLQLLLHLLTTFVDLRVLLKQDFQEHQRVPYLEYDYQLGGLSPGLGLEPWLAGPLLSTLSHAFPGFLSHTQAAYASYLTSPTSMATDLLPPPLLHTWDSS